MFRKLVLITVLCCICPGLLWPKELKIDLSARTPTNMALRSVVLPGWGQHENGNTTKAYIIGGAVLFSGAAACYYFDRANTTYEEYADQGVRDNALYSDYESQYGKANALTVAAIVLWVYGIMDAYGDASENFRSEEERKKAGFKVSADGKSVAAVFTTEF